jgi:predicted secreted protein
MSITTVLAIYFILWWVVLFAVLPWGVRSQHETGEIVPGSDPGAPATHLVWRKVLWTTLITSVIFAILYVAYTSGLIPFDWLAAISGPPRRY